MALSGSEKTSVVKRSSIPGPETTIITLGLSTGDHPAIEERWLDWVGGGCGAALSGFVFFRLTHEMDQRTEKKMEKDGVHQCFSNLIK